MKYFKLIVVTYRFYLIRLLEFRGEVISWSILGIFWGILSYFTIQLIFNQVNSIAGWEKNEVLILTGVHQIFIHFCWFFLLPSILRFATSIREGNLDSVLLKPINPRFSLSFSEFQFTNYVPLLFNLGFVIWIMSHANINISFLSLTGFLTLFIMGIFLFYCLFYAAATTSFYFINIFNLENFFDNIIGVGRFPTQIFGNGLFFVFTLIIPVAFLATFPTQFLVGKGSFNLILIGLVLCVVFFALSQWFWNFALKRYSSVSS